MSVTASPTGSYSAIGITFPAGPDSVTAVARNAGGTSSPAVSSFTTLAPPTVAILTPANGGTATTTPTISGTATPLASVTVSVPGNAPVTVTADNSGAWTVPTGTVSLTAGPVSITATAGNAGGLSAPAVSSVTAVAPACAVTLTNTGPGSCVSLASLSVSSSQPIQQLDWFRNGTLVFSSTPQSATAGITVAGGNGPGSGANQLYYNYGICMDGSGFIYAADNNNHRIQKFAPNSTSLSSGTTVAGGNGAGNKANQLNSPVGVYVDGSGFIYVADSYNHRIQKFAPNSTSLSSGTTVAGGNGKGSAANQLDFPGGLSVDGSGAVYVADGAYHRIKKFAPNSTSLTNGIIAAGGNGPGNADDQLYVPVGVAFDGSGAMYVIDNNNYRIQKFAPNSTSLSSGTTVAGGNGPGSAANQLNSPQALYVDTKGAIYVADFTDSRVRQFAPNSTSLTDGITVAGGNGGGNGANQLDRPFGVYVNSSGAIYVSDSYNHRIQKWDGIALPNPVYAPVAAGTYTVRVTAADGCTALSNAVTITDPVVSISPASQTITAVGNVTLTASGATSYTWSNGSTTNPLVVSNVTSTTAFSVTGLTGGCSATATATITVSIDSDGDGVTDQDDLDDDNDGILDTTENCITQAVAKAGVLAFVGVNTYAASTLPGSPTPDFNSFGNPANLVDGKEELNFGYKATDISAFSSGLALIGLTFPTAKVLTGIELKTLGGGGSFLSSDAVVAVQGRNSSNSPWINIVSSLTASTGSQSVKFPFPANTTAYTEYQVAGVAGSVQVSDWVLEVYFTGACNYDLDNDGIANTLDLDSDGDGCPDAIEGGASFKLTDLVSSTMAGGNGGAGYTGTSTSPVTKNLGNTVGSTGIPISAGTGQTIGRSGDSSVQDPDCAAPPTIAITSPATGGTATTTPTMSGTATPGAVVSIKGGPTSTGGPVSVTANATTGAYSTTAITFPAGPASVTAIATNTGGSSTPAIVSFTAVSPASLTVAPTGPQTSTAPVVSGTATPGSTVVITGPGPLVLCSTTASASGTFACAVSVPAGPQTLTVTACTSAGCSTATTSFTAVAPPTVAILSPATNGMATTTPTISGTATPNAVVTLTGSPGTTGGPVSVTADPVTGAYSTSAITFPAGPNSVTAVATTIGGTSTPATTSFTATGPPSLTVTTPPAGTMTPTISGTTTPNTPVVITGPEPVTLCTTTSTASGIFSCSVTVPTGPTTLTVTATGPGGSTSVPVTVSAVAPPTVAILSPATNGTATTTPTISGTATPNAVVTLTGGSGTTGGPVSVTADPVTGAYSTSAITFPAGPASVTAVATNVGGTSTPAIDNFTVVAPPSLTVSGPVNVSTVASPTVSGTATPNSVIVITNPAGQSICQTTADQSGLFACGPVTGLPTGPNQLTVTATTPGGGTSVPISFTTVAPPTVAILTPADNSTQPAGTKLISGTATPGATVVLTTSTGESLTTAANPSGAFSATTAAPFPVGPDAVTATGSNAGGITSTSSNFTVVSPPNLTVLTPANNGTATATPTVSGTATPGSLITITGPTGATLCSTTATMPSSFTFPGPLLYVGPSGPVFGAPVVINNPGGAYSCTLTSPLPTGQKSLTVTATNASGSVSQPVTFTVVGPPSLTVTGPVNVSTTTSPLVSGTATPGSVITITDYDGTVVCSTTATSGTFVCGPIGPLPTGPNTLTVTATTPGGTVSQPVRFTTVAPPTVAILSPATNGTALATPTISGTATPNAVVTITGGPGSTGGPVSVTADPTTGAYSTSALTFPQGSASVTVVATNAGGTSSPAIDNFTVVAPTTVTAPVVISDIANTNPGVPVTGNVLANDSDPSGLPLTATLTSPPAAGTATISPDGSFTYTPPTGFTGTVSFCYSASSTAGLSGSACVSVNVNPTPSPVGNNAPIANNDNTQTTAGVPVTVAVLANDTDPDSATGSNGQLSNPTLVSQPAVGTAVVNGNGSITYTPPAGFTGIVSLPYTVCDRATSPVCATALVSITVLPTPLANTTLAPVTVDDALLVRINTPATGNVSTNDSDPQGLPLTYTVGQPTSGTVTMLPTGSYIYAPAPGFTGPASFTYAVCNGSKCSKATVSVDVQVSSSLAVSIPIRVFLQGALVNPVTAGRMRDDLRTKDLLPAAEPYTALSYTHTGGGGNETMVNPTSVLSATGSNAIVDWVVVELRSPASLSTVLATRSGLLQADGDVVDVDGVTSLTFGSAVALGTPYYVAVHHRNHLGVMTASPVTTAVTPTLIDFTNLPTTPTYQFPVGDLRRMSAPQTVEGGVKAMWAGNTTGDNQVILQGPNNDTDNVLFYVLGDPNNTQSYANYIRNNVYTTNDVNMDGRVIAQGPDNEVDFIFFEVLNHPDNQAQYLNFIILQQVP